MLMTTLRTGLTGMTGVNFDHLHTSLLGFVCDKVIELSKRPSMQSTLCRDILVMFATSNLARLSDVLEVFQNDRAPRSGVLDDTLAKDVVAISVETRLTLAQFLEMTFRGFRSFRLQLPSYAEIRAVALFPMRVPKELTRARDGWSVQAKVYPNNLIILRNIRLRDFHNDLQPVLSLAVHEVSSSDLMYLVLGLPDGNRKGDTHLATGGRQPSRLLLPVKRVGVDVVSGWTYFTGRALHWLELRNWIALFLGSFNALFVRSFMFLLPSESRGQGFRSLYTGLDKQVAHQSRTGHFRITVRLMMQTHPILFLMLPAICAHLI